MVSIGPTIQIKGEDSYRLAVRKIIQETKELNSEMDLLVSQFDKNTSGLEKNKRQHELLEKQIESSTKQHEKLVEGLEKANQKHEDSKPILEAAKKKVEDLTKKEAELKAKLDEVEKSNGKNSEEWKNAKDAVTAATNELKSAEKELQQADEEFSRSGRVLADWQTTVNKAETELNNLNKEFEKTSPVKAWGEELNNAGEKMEKFGENLTKYVTTPLMGLSTYAVKAASDFEDGMAKIFTIAVDGAEPMEKMHDELIKLSNETGFGLEDLSEATYQAVSASVDATKAVEFMGDATKLARAGFTTTTKAVDVLSTIINSYQMKVEDAAYISDVLLKTQNDGKLIIDELASSLGIIVPMASNYNVGLEQIAASYATMTKQGVPASKATTFLRAVFTELEKESSDVADILMNKTGKSFAQLMGSGMDLSEVLRILYNEAGQDAEKFQRLFGNVRATQAVAALVTGDFSILEMELKRMENATGQTDKALEQLETPSLKAKRAVNQLKNSAMSLGETMIDMLYPSFESATSKIKDLTDAFIALSPETKAVIVNGIALAASVGPVVTLLGKAAKYIGGLMLGTASIVPLIAGAAAAFGGLAIAAHAMNVEHIENIRAENDLGLVMSEQITKLQELKDAHKDFKVSMQEKNTETLNEVSYVRDLVAQYDSLVGKNGKVKDSNKKLADTLLGEIATSLGMTKEEVKDLTDKHGKLSKSIEKNIQDYQKQAEAAVYTEQLTEATRRRTAAEKIERDTLAELTSTSEIANETSKRLGDAQRTINDALAAGKPVTQDMIDELAGATVANKQAQEQMMALRGNLEEARKEVSSASEDIEFYGDKLDGLSGKSKKTADDIEKDSKRSSSAVKTSVDESSKALDNASKGSYNSGADFMKGFARGIDDYAYLAARAASTAGNTAYRTLNNTVQVASPSKLTHQTGEYFVEGFANALNEGIPMLGNMAEKLGLSASSGLGFGSYIPETASVVNNTKTISAPISIALTVNGNVDNEEMFTRKIAENLVDLIKGERSVFA